ncbi:putative membrane protein DUF2232 [Natranaerovirga pectinivora]|uniref:Putative membrane protein DUF2232 n=1 Tax=Natranaerovirga pectinivora TaxID=682400 RepID=A0A4R3MGN8_9FIRM|nr:DUF2232 domain-containing protein [Natranaerovirga pectinivora]TCT13135.1 putative membrane protein DUF2232 [Natranaerovirga pectinivora]
MNNRNDILSLLGVIIVISVYSYLLGITASSIIVLELIFAIPIIIYVYKKNINMYFIGAVVISLLYHAMVFDNTGVLLLLLIYIIPSVIIGCLIRRKKLLSETVAFVTIIYFLSIILIIFSYNQIYQVDIIKDTYDSLETVLLENKDVFEEMFQEQPSFTFEQYVYEVISTSKYYYISFIFILSLISIFIKVLLARTLLNILGWKEFKLNSIIKYNPPRSFLLFFLIIIVLQGLTEHYSFVMTTSNLIVICIFILFSVGILFEIYLIKVAKNFGMKIVLLLISIICLLFMPFYFVVIGVVEILFKIRENKSISKN